MDTPATRQKKPSRCWPCSSASACCLLISSSRSIPTNSAEGSASVSRLPVRWRLIPKCCWPMSRSRCSICRFAWISWGCCCASKRKSTCGYGLRALPQRRGEIPSLITPPSGCRFHPRCPHAMEVCRQRFPKRTDLGGGHWTNCFLYGDGGTDYERVPLADAAAPVSPAQTQVDGNGSLGKSKENI